MNANLHTRRVVTGIAAGVGLAAASYAACAAVAWLRYGKPARATSEEEDPLLDRFMPVYEIVERHRIDVAAPAEMTLAAARQQDLWGSAVVRAIFKAREFALGGLPDNRARPRGLIAEMQALGWGVLAEEPGHEVVLGAVTRPWEANPVFRALPPDEFGAFNEHGFVKIAWTLRADPVDSGSSILRLETRAVATDPVARKRFRRYWTFVSPGVVLIRWLLLPLVKHDAERHAATASAAFAA
jgi:hypothetical protein